jgi:hypothetical protein
MDWILLFIIDILNIFAIINIWFEKIIKDNVVKNIQSNGHGSGIAEQTGRSTVIIFFLNQRNFTNEYEMKSWWFQLVF